ncbi:MAG: MBL fold metallo-hydrolase [Bacteroidota bacterium]
MGMTLQLVVHGRGNAWPVPLGETHPFYNMKDPRDLSNAAFSLVASDKGRVVSDVLVDAGHGTVQSLISGSNRIPDSICLTHGHMDHTLSVDWIVQSFWRRHEKERLFPVYTTAPVYQFLLSSYPHLEPLIDFRELVYGKTIQMENAPPFRLTAYPVFHGTSAVGASMLLFEMEERRVLFSGDLLTPLLRSEDYDRLKGVDLLVVDINNRFPWPRTNHWSFTGQPENFMDRSKALKRFIDGLSWKDVTAPHDHPASGEAAGSYFRQLEDEWNLAEQPFTILEFLKRIEPQQVMPVHYSGAEDSRYYSESILSGKELLSWIIHSSQSAGIASRYIVPEAGQVIPL